METLGGKMCQSCGKIPPGLKSVQAFSYDSSSTLHPPPRSSSLSPLSQPAWQMPSAFPLNKRDALRLAGESCVRCFDGTII